MAIPLSVLDLVPVPPDQNASQAFANSVELVGAPDERDDASGNPSFDPRETPPPPGDDDVPF